MRNQHPLERLERLAELVTQAQRDRRNERGLPLTDEEARIGIGISRETLKKMKAPPPTDPPSDQGIGCEDRLYRPVEDFFHWLPGSILKYLDHDGPEPEEIPEPQPGYEQLGELMVKLPEEKRRVVDGIIHSLLQLPEEKRQVVDGVIQSLLLLCDEPARAPAPAGRR